jgi:hypothetical protein
MNVITEDNISDNINADGIAIVDDDNNIQQANSIDAIADDAASNHDDAASNHDDSSSSTTHSDKIIDFLGTLRSVGDGDRSDYDGEEEKKEEDVAGDDDNSFKSSRDEVLNGVTLDKCLNNRRRIVNFEEFSAKMFVQFFCKELKNRKLPRDFNKCIEFADEDENNNCQTIILKLPICFWSNYLIDLFMEEHDNDDVLFNYAKNRIKNKKILLLVFGLVATFNSIDDEEILASRTQILTKDNNDISLFHILSVCKDIFDNDYNNYGSNVGCLFPLVYCIYINSYPYLGTRAHFPSIITKKTGLEILKKDYGLIAQQIFNPLNDFNKLFYRNWDAGGVVIIKNKKQKGKRKRKNKKQGGKKKKTKADENEAINKKQQREEAAALKKAEKEAEAALKKIEKEIAKQEKLAAAALKKAEKEAEAALKKIEKENAAAQQMLDEEAAQLANKENINECSEEIFNTIVLDETDYKTKDNSSYRDKCCYESQVKHRSKNWEEITNKIRENPTFSDYSICSIGQYIELTDMLIYVSCEKHVGSFDIIMLDDSDKVNANTLVEYISSSNSFLNTKKLILPNIIYKYSPDSSNDDEDTNIIFTDQYVQYVDNIPYINGIYFIAANTSLDENNYQKYLLFKRVLIDIYMLKDIVVARNQKEAEIIWTLLDHKTVLTFSGYIKYNNGTILIRDYFF